MAHGHAQEVSVKVDRIRLQNNWSLFWKKLISSCPVSSPICWGSVPADAEGMAQGETNSAALAALADKHLRATPEQLCDALGPVPS